MATLGSKNVQNIEAMVAAGEITRKQADEMLKKAKAQKQKKAKSLVK